MINSTSTDISSAKGAPTSPETNSSNHSHEDEDDSVMYRSRKSYPQRNNRPKLNYRDLERGVYDRHELRQSAWALGGPSFLKTEKTRTNKTDDLSAYSDEEEEEDQDDNETLTVDEEDDRIGSNGKKKSNEESDQLHRRLWCICRKPWDHSRLMLRCDSCSNWYHGDCIGMTKEQARNLDLKGDQFVCPPCKGVGQKTLGKSNRLSDDSLMMKRKHISPSERKSNENPPAKTTPQSEPSKRPKTGIFFHRDTTPAEPQVHCIVHGCTNWAKAGWVYCSPACIRRHINETLQAIQRSKGPDNENPPLREDILLYESRTKKLLDRKLVPKIEDLCTWINQHPSYEIVKPALRQSILLTANESKVSPPLNPSLARSTSVSSSIGSPRTPTTPSTPTPTNKIKPSWVPIAPNTKSAAPVKKTPVTLSKPTASTAPAKSVGQNNTADIRSKVPVALYDKLLMRVEKSGEKTLSNDEIRTVADKIEEEMFRVYGKVDNSYKNKFRSLLANISNMNNDYFYKQVLSKEVTAKQIVAMKPEDMLPPEEKEKRKDNFEKEVQMIIKAEEQTAEEMARRARIKVTRQGLVENDAVPPIFKPQETNIVEEKEEKPKPKTDDSSTEKPVLKPKKPVPTSSVIDKPKKAEVVAPEPTTVSVAEPVVTVKSPSPPPPVPEPIAKPIEKPVEVKVPSPPTPVETNPIYPSTDIDNDYIEPESPTGIDALLYDDDDDLNNTSSYSRSSSISQTKSSDSPTETPPAFFPTTRDDYNPLAATKPKIDASSTYQPTPLSRQSWRGFINLPDAKLPCQSHRIFGESDYLVSEIPEQLSILGRLRLGDLWIYTRDSLPVRDVVILTLSSDNPQFLRYVDTMRTSGRAAVLSKRVEPTFIRDMYILAADTKDCPSTVLSALSMSTTVDPKHLFLVVIASSKRTMKSSIRANENPSSSNLTYKPVSLQPITPVTAAAPVRDPRLSRNKDPRLPSTSTTVISPPDISVPPVVPIQPSSDHAKKIVSDTFEHIRHASSLATIQSLAHSTVEFLKSNGQTDLCAQFTQQLPAAITAWQTASATAKKNELPSDDNLNEENMEVEDQSDDRQQKKGLSFSEFNDVDYRFLDHDDMDHRLASLANDDQDSDLRS